MAFQILNQSINAITFKSIHSVKYTSNLYNLNCGTEYLSEIILCIKNSFPAFQKKNNSNKSQSVKHISFNTIQPIAIHIFINQYVKSLVFAYPTDEKYSFHFLKEITPQPPKAWPIH